MRHDVLNHILSDEEMKDLKNLTAIFISLDKIGQLLIMNSANTLKMEQSLNK